MNLWRSFLTHKAIQNCLSCHYKSIFSSTVFWVEDLNFRPQIQSILLRAYLDNQSYQSKWGNIFHSHLSFFCVCVCNCCFIYLMFCMLSKVYEMPFSAVFFSSASVNHYATGRQFLSTKSVIATPTLGFWLHSCRLVQH